MCFPRSGVKITCLLRLGIGETKIVCTRKQSGFSNWALVVFLVAVVLGLQIPALAISAPVSGNWMLTKAQNVDLGTCSGFETVVVEVGCQLTGKRVGRTKRVLGRLDPHIVLAGSVDVTTAADAGVPCLIHADGKTGVVDVGGDRWVDWVIARIRQSNQRDYDGWV